MKAGPKGHTACGAARRTGGPQKGEETLHTQKGPGQAGAQPAPQAGHSAGCAAAAPRCDRAKLWPLFLATLYISTFTFGGGFVIVTFMKRKFVDSLKWLSEEEMLDFAALAQASPGAIAVNAAILVGWRVCGFAGMAVAVLGGAAPAPGNVQWASAALFCAALVLLRWRKWNPILVMCLCGAASLALGAAGLVPV